MTFPLADPDFDRVPGYGRFFRDLAAGRLPADLDTLHRPDRPADWERVLEARPPFAIGDGLAATLRVEHRRLGAGAAALSAIDDLAAGRASVVLTGQQPGLLGGPLYTRLKVATAVALAAELTRRHGRPFVPLYWNAADDADFDEVSHGALPRSDLKILRFSLSSDARVPRGWIGDIPVAALGEALASAEGAGLPEEAWSRWRDWQGRAAAEAGDFGRFHAAQYLEWFHDTPLLVVDARWPELRRAAAGLFDRYLSESAGVAVLVEREGARMAAHGYEPPITAEAAAAALFLTPGRVRLRLPPEEALAEARSVLATHPSHLSPNVVLRPLVNDVVFPVAAHVAGPAELQYLTQLVPVYDRLGVSRPVVADRAAMTLVPAIAEGVAEGLPGGVVELLADPGEGLRRWFDGRMPGELRVRIEAARQGLSRIFEELKEPSRQVDASLGQILESAREKALFQFERFPEGTMKKIRQKEELTHPGLQGLSDFLRPRARLQERELSALAPGLLLGDGAGELLARVARAHVENLFSGRRRHFLVRA